MFSGMTEYVYDIRAKITVAQQQDMMTQFSFYLPVSKLGKLVTISTFYQQLVFCK